MKLIIDLEEIKQLSEEHEEENWGFRSFLKSGVIPSRKIDAIAQRLYAEVESQIDCTQCGNCCRSLETVFTGEDILQFSKQFKLTRLKFEEKYLEKNEDDKYILNKIPCPYLEGKMCSVYDSRPGDCDSYPHIYKKSLVPRLISIIHNCAVCPIVYNLYERLKSEIWDMSDDPDEPGEFDDFL
ncbi:MAG: YkgJ family cysteine cluster protein [bacterium]|nr:YkgJ family cysteine cluster protein [bacterium]